jgi:uncharacterized membrane protein YfcA
LATAYSLFIVGSTALVGGLRSYQQNLVDIRTTIVFAIPSFITVFLTRLFLVPRIPNEIISIGDFTLTRDIGIMIFFSIIMIAASVSMIRGKQKEKENPGDQTLSYNYPMIVLEGAVVGLLTGIVGAGGGFLIIPALVLFAKLPMKLAVGTSLLIIATKSLIGFIGDIGSGQPIDYSFLLSITVIAIGGIFVGIYISKFIASSKLKKAFGWFVLIMAFYIIVKEIFG